MLREWFASVVGGYRASPTAGRLAVFFSGVSVLLLLQYPAMLAQAELPPNVQNTASMMFDAERNGLRTTTNNVPASPALVVASYAASAPAGVNPASGSMNVACTYLTCQVAVMDPITGAGTNVTSSPSSIATASNVLFVAGESYVYDVPTAAWVRLQRGNATAAQSIPVTIQSTAGASSLMRLDTNTDATGAYVQSGSSDGDSNRVRLYTTAYTYYFNGTTWERSRSGIITSSATTGFLNIMGGRQVAIADGASLTLTDYAASVNAIPRTYNATNNVMNILREPAIAEGATGTVSISQDYRYSNLTTNASTLLKATPGLIHTLTVNTRGTTSSVRLLDAASCAAGTTPIPIANVDTTLSTTAFIYDVKTTSGICVVTAGAAAADLTLSFR